MPTTGHPSAEELAAYIDGNLGKEEAARVTAHLASCDDCFNVYSDTVQFLLADEPVAPETNVVRFPRRKLSQRRRSLIPDKTAARAAARWLPIAALLLVGVGSGTYYLLLALPPGLVTSEVTPPFPNPAQTDRPLWLGPTYRGESGEEEAKIEEASFRMGVQLVNLQASLKAGKVPESQDVVARILGLVKPQPFTDDLYKRYTRITAALDHKAPNELLPEAVRLTKESREPFDVTFLDLGQWVEAGRMAALARNPTFFQQPDIQSFLRRLRWREKLGIGDTKLDPVIRESLGQISEIVSKGDLQASDYAQLQTQLDKILEKYYPET